MSDNSDESVTAARVEFCHMMARRTRCGAPSTLGCQSCAVGMAALAERDQSAVPSGGRAAP